MEAYLSLSKINERLRTHLKAYKQTLLAALFTITQNLNSLRCLPTGELIADLWDTEIMEYCLTVKMTEQLECNNITRPMLSERS